MTTSGLITAANLQQLEAITTTEGPLLIIAGPGSGKTFTLVERVVYLLTEKGTVPERIMVVTFTDKAAQELTTRISNRLDQLDVRFNLNEMYLGTFHAICLRWLQDYREFTRLKHNFTVFDEFDQHYFVYQRFSVFEALEGLTHLAGRVGASSTWDRSEPLVKWLNTVAEEALDIQALLAAPDAAIAALGRCAQLYRTLLEENNALDFSTIQWEALRLLRGYPSVRDALHAQIAYAMVDEYQDTNTIQEHILLELVGTDTPNLCVVGDDDQGIYRFRGATIRNILQFGSTFTCPRKQVALEINYRSHPTILRKQLLEELVAVFLTDLAHTNRLPYIRHAYATDVAQSCVFYRGPVQAITAEVLRTFSGMHLHVSSATGACKQAVVIRFLTWAHQHELLDTNPMLKIERMKLDARQSRGMACDQILRALAGIPPTDRLRDQLFFRLRLEAGLRISEGTLHPLRHTCD